MIFSFIPPFYIVVPNREIANINPFITLSTMSNLTDFNKVSEDIQMGALRDRYRVISINTSRELSMYSITSSMEYAACMEAQNKDSN